MLLKPLPVWKVIRLVNSLPFTGGSSVASAVMLCWTLDGLSTEPWWESTVRVGMRLGVVRVRFFHGRVKFLGHVFLSLLWAAHRALGLEPNCYPSWRNARGRAYRNSTRELECGNSHLGNWGRWKGGNNQEPNTIVFACRTSDTLSTTLHGRPLVSV